MNENVSASHSEDVPRLSPEARLARKANKKARRAAAAMASAATVVESVLDENSVHAQVSEMPSATGPEGSTFQIHVEENSPAADANASAGPEAEAEAAPADPYETLQPTPRRSRFAEFKSALMGRTQSVYSRIAGGGRKVWVDARSAKLSSNTRQILLDTANYRAAIMNSPRVQRMGVVGTAVVDLAEAVYVGAVTAIGTGALLVAVAGAAVIVHVANAAAWVVALTAAIGKVLFQSVAELIQSIVEVFRGPGVTVSHVPAGAII